MIQILIVDDEKPICDLIQMSLTRAGYHCTCVYDGLAAADILERNVFDLILLDVMLPLMDGFEASRLILKYHPNLVILALTANVTEEERTKCREAGMTDIVGKPVTTEKLKNVINAFSNIINESLKKENGGKPESDAPDKGKKKPVVVRPLDE